MGTELILLEGFIFGWIALVNVLVDEDVWYVCVGIEHYFINVGSFFLLPIACYFISNFVVIDEEFFYFNR